MQASGLGEGEEVGSEVKEEGEEEEGEERRRKGFLTRRVSRRRRGGGEELAEEEGGLSREGADRDPDTYHEHEVRVEG